MKREIVLVKWHDARFFPDVYTAQSVKEQRMAIFQSLGYLIQKDETTTMIATEINNIGEYRGITLIPTGSIVSIKKLLPVLAV